jgi:hypothetical protein
MNRVLDDALERLRHTEPEAADGAPNHGPMADRKCKRPFGAAPPATPRPRRVRRPQPGGARWSVVWTGAAAGGEGRRGALGGQPRDGRRRTAGGGRNPIYLSCTLPHLGLGIWLNSAWILGLLVPTRAVVSFGVSPRKERYLPGKFGEEYLRSTQEVRRWIEPAGTAGGATVRGDESAALGWDEISNLMGEGIASDVNTAARRKPQKV